MKVIVLDEPQYQYLMHAFAGHSQAGLPPQELILAALTYRGLASARDVDDTVHLGKAEITELGPKGIALNLTPDQA